ncbi:hypothetical protein N7G274_001622 [Stereocaulon virgatum]|uniref:DUF7730 domain-containing protein n=1 Tax=Stereocaulon virgatum TaxID=373712 RepID=A0ABR4AK86_9LECA
MDLRLLTICIHSSTPSLLALPVELQFRIYCLALFNAGAYHITVQNNRKVFNVALNIKKDEDFERLQSSEVDVFPNLRLFGHHVAIAYPCGCKIAQESKFVCNKKLHLCQEKDPYKRMGCACNARPTGLALFSVCHLIRKVAVPIFYGDNVLDLVLREETLPFLQDLTPLACESIRKISLTIQLYNTHLEEQGGRAKVLDHIAKYLKGLRSLVVTVYDESDTFAHFDARLRKQTSLVAGIKDRQQSRAELERMRLSAVNELLQRWDMMWLRALAGIRGLSNFEFTLHTMVITSTDGWHMTEAFKQGPVTTQAILRSCLEHRVRESREEVKVDQPPLAEPLSHDDREAGQDHSGKRRLHFSLARRGHDWLIMKNPGTDEFAATSSQYYDTSQNLNSSIS